MSKKINHDAKVESSQMTVGDILYRIANTRDQDLDLYQRELKALILRRGLLHQREPHDPPAKPP